MYQANLYYDTGFNAINIPYDADVLAAAARKIETYPAMDIITNQFLTEIRIKITPPFDFENFGHVDYVDVFDANSHAYYSVTAISPTSQDVVVLGLVMDPIMTYGIVAKMSRQNGVVMPFSVRGFIERATHFSGFSPDDINRFTLTDPLLKPQYQTQHEKYLVFGPSGGWGEGGKYSLTHGNAQDGSYWLGTEDTWNLYGSSYKNTIDKDVLAEATAPVSITATEKESGNFDYEYSQNFNTTRYSIGQPRDEKTTVSMGFHDYEYPGLTFYGDRSNENEAPGSAPNFLETAQTLYNFGIPNPIAVSYQLPVGFVLMDALNPNGYAFNGYKKGVYSKITGVTGTFTLDKTIYDFIWDFNHDGQPESTNPNVLKKYGAYVAHAIALQMRMKLSAVGTGQEATITPADLEPHIAAPISVYLQADPTPYGAPYYAWRTRYNLLGWISSESPLKQVLITSMYGAVRGATWQPAPVSMSNFGMQNELNGLAVRQAYATKRYDLDFNYGADQLEGQKTRGDVENWERILNFIPDTIGKMADSDGIGDALMTLGSQVTSLVTGSTKQQLDLQDSANAFIYGNAIRSMAIQQELDSFNAAHQASKTDLFFPVSQSLPLFMGNGAVIDIEYPHYYDVKRYIKLMQLYGIYIEQNASGYIIPQKSEISNYCFIKTRGLVITSNGALTKAAAEAAAAALDAGVRIWTKRPSIDLYDSNLYLQK